MLLLLLLLGFIFGGVFLCALLLKAFWPLISKSNAPDNRDAFRYMCMAFTFLLLIVFVALLLLLP